MVSNFLSLYQNVFRPHFLTPSPTSMQVVVFQTVKGTFTKEVMGKVWKNDINVYGHDHQTEKKKLIVLLAQGP